jgi:hypothetical protein
MPHSVRRGRKPRQPVQPVKNIPGTPTGMVVTQNGTALVVDWADTQYATSYTLQRSTTSGGTYTTVGSPLLSTFTDATVAPSTTYWYKVRASNAFGQSSFSTPVSGTSAGSGSIDVDPSDPTGLAMPSGPVSGFAQACGLLRLGRDQPSPRVFGVGRRRGHGDLQGAGARDPPSAARHVLAGEPRRHRLSAQAGRSARRS